LSPTNQSRSAISTSTTPSLSTIDLATAVESTCHALDADAVDLAIMADQKLEQRYRSEIVFAAELVIAMAPRHALANHERVRYADLHNQRMLLHLRAETVKRWFMQMVCRDGYGPGPRELSTSRSPTPSSSSSRAVTVALSRRAALPRARWSKATHWCAGRVEVLRGSNIRVQ